VCDLQATVARARGARVRACTHPWRTYSCTYGTRQVVHTERDRDELDTKKNIGNGARLRWERRGTEREAHREGREVLGKLEGSAETMSRTATGGLTKLTGDPRGGRGGRRRTRRLDEPGRGRCRAMRSLATSSADARKNQRRARGCRS
jgi:hypothetical protein